ncbi:MAG: putative ALANIN-rich signal peptide protein [Burkholderiaceae bacterium]|jgi:hypothetical protein|nr:MAG: putative ALANIN-rich signal peptide protein [Burkholderiaceae bacterium]
MTLKSILLAASFAAFGAASFAQAPAAAPAAPSASVTATCKDGTEFSGASRKGACKGHKGVKTWHSDTAAAGAAPAAAAEPAAKASKKEKAAKMAPAATAAAGGGAGKVWVNTSTKTYHCEGDRYYGKTKVGQYMTESEAKAQGDHPSHGKSCS